MQGTNMDLYRRTTDRSTGWNVTASGGICALDELAELQTDAAASAAILGKALYTGAIPGAAMRLSKSAGEGKFYDNRSASSPVWTSETAGLVKGMNFEGLRDMADPVELARYYNALRRGRAGVLRHHRHRRGARPVHRYPARKLPAEIFIPLTVGGGIDTLDDFDRVLKCGADKVSVNSGAIRRPGPDRRRRRRNTATSAWCFPATLSGWTGSSALFAKGGREDTGMDALDWIEPGVQAGAGEVVLNSIDTDGVKNGFDLGNAGRRGRAGAACPSLPAAAQATWSILWSCSPTPALMPGWRPSIFHTRQVEIRRAESSTCGAVASKCGCEPNIANAELYNKLWSISYGREEYHYGTEI